MVKNELQATKTTTVFGPRAEILASLIGPTTWKTVPAKHDSGKLVNVPLAEHGHSAMAGIHDPLENREWAGMFNHTMKVAGVALILGRLLRLNKGYSFDEQSVVDIVSVSHNGRRHADEEKWYQTTKITSDNEKSNRTDTEIGLEILAQKGFSKDFLNLVAIHGYSHSELEQMTKGSIDSWNLNMIIPAYLDQRIGQNPVSLDDRIAGHRASKRTDEENLQHLETWTRKAELDIFAALKIKDYAALLNNSINMLARTELAIKLGKFSDDEVVAIRGTKEFTEQRKRRIPEKRLDIAEAAGIDQERYLDAVQLTSNDINEKMAQPERWERYLRRLYLNDAEKETFNIILIDKKLKGQITQADIDKEFPPDTWWADSMLQLFIEQKGKPKDPVRRGPPPRSNIKKLFDKLIRLTHFDKI